MSVFYDLYTASCQAGQGWMSSVDAAKVVEIFRKEPTVAETFAVFANKKTRNEPFIRDWVRGLLYGE